MEMTTADVYRIAGICHEANRAYCESIGDNSQPRWKDAQEWQRVSAMNGVQFRWANPGSTPQQSHENWLKEKQDTGWVYGPEKIPALKTHPCMVPYGELPIEQRRKDALFTAIVEALK